jgi:integrase
MTRRSNGPHRDPAPQAWADALDGWEQHQAALGRSPESTRTYRSYLIRLATEHPDGPGTVDGRAVVAWFAAHPHWRPATRKSARKALACFFRWAVDAGVLEVDPSTALGPITVPAGVPRPVDDLVWADSARTVGARRHAGRDRLMLLLAAHAGLRRAEVAAVAREHVTDAGLIVHGKGGRTRVVPLTAELRRELLALPPGWTFPARLDPGGHIHPATVGRVLAEVLGGQGTAHQLRHRFATRAYRGTKDIRAVQTLLGHADPATTAVYTQLDSEALRAAVLAAAS